MLTEDQVRGCLEEEWDLPEARLTRLGMAVARRLDRAGIPAGAPEPTRSGDLTVSVGGHRLGLLAWVPGEPLTGADEGGGG